MRVRDDLSFWDGSETRVVMKKDIDGILSMLRTKKGSIITGGSYTVVAFSFMMMISLSAGKYGDGYNVGWYLIVSIVIFVISVIHSWWLSAKNRVNEQSPEREIG